jgi:Rieske Fe-S protein
VAELEAKQVIEFRYPDAHEPCLALCLEPGRYVAYGQKCSHLSCAVIPHLDRGELHCPCHNGSFEADNGRPVAGPPRRPLPLVRLEVIDGVVYATGFEPRTV